MLQEGAVLRASAPTPLNQLICIETVAVPNRRNTARPVSGPGLRPLHARHRYDTVGSKHQQKTHHSSLAQPCLCNDFVHALR